VQLLSGWGRSMTEAPKRAYEEISGEKMTPEEIWKARRLLAF
jgi:hypothetical protein